MNYLASNTLFHLSLSNATSISSNKLISFKVFQTVSYHLCRGLPLIFFPLNYFLRLSLSSPNVPPIPAFSWLRNVVDSAYCTVVAGFHLILFGYFPSHYFIPVHILFCVLSSQNSIAFLHRVNS